MENDDQSFNKDNKMGQNANASDKTSADEVKDRVKETVAKGVAAVAGALKGFSEEAKKHDLPNATKDAIQKAGETTRTIAGTATDEFQRTKEHVKNKAQGVGSSGSVGSGYRSSSTSVPDLRKTELGKTDEDLEE